MEQHAFRFGAQIYYVPKFDPRLARYIPITCLRLSLNPPLLVLGHHLAISPKLQENGNIARDFVGTYWISKEAYEAYNAREGIWRRIWRSFDAFSFAKSAEAILHKLLSPAGIGIAQRK